jgi:hypothetical protein
MRVGSGLSNGVRQYAVSVDNNAWYQLESQTGGLVADTGLAAAMPVMRWRGQAGTGTDAGTVRSNTYDYAQGYLIQNTSATQTLYLTTTYDQVANGTPTNRLVANAIAIAPGGSLKLDATDGSKIYLRASGALVAAVLAV